VCRSASAGDSRPSPPGTAIHSAITTTAGAIANGRFDRTRRFRRIGGKRKEVARCETAYPSEATTCGERRRSSSSIASTFASVDR